MTVVRKFNPRGDRDLAAFTRDVAEALRADERGLVWADNVGPVIEYAHDNADTPYQHTLDLPEAPASVIVLRAQTPAGTFISGGAVEWSYSNGVLSVGELGALTSGTSYDVRLGVLKG